MTKATKRNIRKKIVTLKSKINGTSLCHKDICQEIALLIKQLGILIGEANKLSKSLDESGTLYDQLQRKLAYCVCDCQKCMHEENCCYGCTLKQFPNMPSKQ